MSYSRVRRRLPVVTFIALIFLLSLFTLMYKLYSPILVSNANMKSTARLKDSFTAATLLSSNCTRMPVWTKGEYKFFDDRYSNISTIWSSKHKEMTPEALQWWLRIQQSKDTFSTSDLRNLVGKLLEIIPDVMPYATNVSNRCLQCAVVGNSGNLRDSRYGQLIDSHDYIMRMNTAKTVGFEKDVGSRTTHHFMYPESFVEVIGETKFVLIPFKPLDVSWLISALTTGTIVRTYMPVRKQINVSKKMIEVYNPAFMYYVHKTWNELHGRYPSTGMLVLLFAMHICDQVNVFGFGATSKGNWDHYYQPPVEPSLEKDSAFKLTGVHNAEFETDIVKQLEEIGKITVYRGSRV
ncbi:CMP-N-acetylneuraminate-beta-galactosamide-alpha-2,3-sialyltransferase 2-like [Saccoglossus kowalevskii]|uniref:CMP-N-acetylneuraminate-beta-galactosamide-alpha-2,3-sialyltransferase 2 n=1 Tax=Saccoglossus kowalevskii TaxID=10224 RepID=A0A0U2UAG8_SACKO|nr:PREDICTED: CMP-N-acetylneuraminate-beta-galactosamide-alpha-2,3-sialyltransferase 2-like [Saccoglossus kowalevskii]ALR88575.1 cmp-n-acetylneuraminate-beta-galactosamide-alpha-23-sialyltransferase 2-like 202 [Saccoglossus kowalevskii]